MATLGQLSQLMTAASPLSAACIVHVTALRNCYRKLAWRQEGQGNGQAFMPSVCGL